MSINDRQLAFLRGQGYTGSINDAYRTYLLAQLGVTTGSIDDLLYNYLKVRWGYTGNLNDMMHAHLRYLGYTGSLSDMLRAAWGVAGIAGLSFSANLTTSLRPEYTGGSSAPTFTRATTATVFDNESVLRNVLSGEARFQGARRVYNLITLPTETITAGAGWTVANGTCVSGVSDPNGGTAASTITATSANAITYKGISGSASNTYTTSVFIRRRTGTGTVTIVGPDGSTIVDITSSISTTWRRFSITGAGGATTFAHTARVATIGDAVDVAFPMLENVTGQSNQAPAEYVSVGVLSTPFHGAGVDGVKYFSTTNGNSVASNVVTESAGSPISASTLLGYLAEGARTNVQIRSQELQLGYAGGPFNSTWSADQAVAPDGTTTADKLLSDTTNGAHGNQNTTGLLSAGALTYSCYAKAAEYPRFGVRHFDSVAAAYVLQATFDLVAGTVVNNPTGTASIQALPNGWYRCIVSGTTTGAVTQAIEVIDATHTVQQSYVGSATSGIYLWGAQLEAGSFASTYIPTTTASVVRNADVLTYPSAGNVSGSIGSAYAEAAFTNAAFLTGLAANIVGTSTTGRFIEANASTTLRCIDSAANLASKTLSTALSSSVSKLASSWSVPSGMFVTANGEAPASQATFTSMSLTGGIGIMCRNDGTAQPFGTIRNVRIYSAQLSAAQLSAVTA